MRVADSDNYMRIFDDDGYIYACTCGARHGPNIKGRRDILIKKCAEHAKKKEARDEDLERLAKNFWKVDPHSEKFIRKQHAMGSNNKTGRPKGT